MKKCFFILIVAISLVSCSGSHLTILVDPWWELAYDSEDILSKHTGQNNPFKLNKIEKNIVGSREEAIDKLNLLSDSDTITTVIVTPALYSYLDNISSPEKKINYIILNGFYDDTADNVIAVYSAREEVYYQAGVKAAIYSMNNDNCNVASVFYNGSALRVLEKENFIKGFNSVENRGELIYYEQKTYTGGESLKRFINSAPDKGVGLFFLSASSLNPYCLELVSLLSIAVSGENLNSLGFYNELVEFSVDDDMIEIIQTAVKIGLDGAIQSDIPVKPLIREKGIHF